ncbi:thiamine-phosphate kinase [Luteolibacter flavescens]|uniref:Thiamine-monophosphate kinase n=1 Tax=Luteolibacter flavescens TaxID=1859460 RepID=A0ABT3FKE2_9BACT|nr:thiamine-phosphate kinase [Luteolibacter flavescens]MCW1884042.1 thiamine-phosphate kinase [Luteolibacter flavescens]
MKRLRDLGEDALIARMLRGFPGGESLLVGPGDDCAVVDPGRGPLRLLKTDAIVEGVHFLPDTPAEKVGWKSVARVISDFAAMGGKPEHLLVTVAVDAEKPVAWMDGLYRGIRKCLATHGGVLAGGETSRLPDGALISVAGEGSVERRHLVLRSGGKPGDLVVVTGRLGGSIRGKHLTFTPRLAEAAWLVRHLRPSAMMDLSDGLAKDLPRLAAASGCGFEIDPGALPANRGCTRAQALGDGEDYELLFTVPPRRWRAAADQWPKGFPPLSIVGTLRPPGQGQGDALTGGWDHFSP